MRHVLVLATLLVACADGSSVLRVSVDSAQTLSGVDHLFVDVIAPDAKHAQPVNVAVVGGEIPPAVSFALRFPKNIRGRVVVLVDAQDATGSSLAHVEDHVEIAPSGSFELSLRFGDGADGGVDAMAPDLTEGDLTRSSLPPTQLAFTAGPANAAFGYRLADVDITVQDTMGQATTSTEMVTVALDNPGTAHLRGTLTVAAVNGVARFSDLRIDGPGTFTLSATAPNLTGATSASFEVTAPSWAQATTGVYGGAILSLAAGGTRLYAGSQASGAFVSTNGGLSWTPAQSGLPKNVRSLAVDPMDNLVAWAATDVGIYKTSDGGTSWQLSFADTPTPLGFSFITVDPANRMRILASTFQRVIVTTNGGTNWVEDSTGLDNGGDPVAEVRSIHINGTTLYAATYHGGLWTKTGAGAWSKIVGVTDGYCNWVVRDPNGKLWVGADGGLWTDKSGSWAKLATGTPNFLKPMNVGRVRIDPSDANKMFATSNDASMTTGGVYYSTDGGTVWSLASGALTGIKVNDFIIDPSMTTRQFGANNRGIYRGSTGSWTASFGGLTALPLLTVNPTAVGTVYAGTDNGGLFVTTDSGMNWGPANGTSGTPLNGFGKDFNAVLPGGGMTLFAAGNLGIFKSTDAATTWSELTNGITFKDIHTMAVAPTDAMLLYAGYGQGMYKTINGGTQFTDGNLSGQGTIATVAIDPTTSSTVYAGTGSAGMAGTVWKTTNGGGMWNAMGAGLPATARIRAIAIDPNDAMALHAATTDGLYRSVDAALTWTGPATGITGTPLSVAVHPQFGNVILASTTTGAFRSYDAGATFSALNGGLADTLVNTVAFDRGDAATMWLGTAGAGVYKTP